VRRYQRLDRHQLQLLLLHSSFSQHDRIKAQSPRNYESFVSTFVSSLSAPKVRGISLTRY
ncbi:MAG TPA: hypothetical protein VEC99_01855, partial [Clostridia bacterium]|nr:hypothetical protein [Clostridia bacterium]